MSDRTHTSPHAPAGDTRSDGSPAGASTAEGRFNRLLEQVNADGTAAAGPVPAAVPGFDVLGPLGRGGMGVVYKARQVDLGRVVALKMILAGGHATDAELALFEAEAAAVAAIRHANVVPVYHAGRHAGLPYFAMEYVPGGTLADAIQAGPLPPADAARVAEAVARGTAAAHAAGVLHRDLKPANVLLAADGTPLVTDFGLAKRLDVSDGPTATGAVMGTPSFMAPEQARGEPVAFATDVYGVGAILYACLTGRPPFQGPSTVDTLRQVTDREPVAVRQLQPGCPRDLETIALKCLEKDPARRYATAADLADDLRRWMSNEPIVARPAGSVERAAKWVRRNRTAAVAAAAVFAALAAGTGVSLWQAGVARQEAANARAAGQTATRQADRAEANLKLAGQAVDDCYRLTADDPLLQGDAMQPVRARLYAAAGKHYQAFVEQAADDPDARAAQAANLERLARITSLTGSTADAGPLIDRAIAVWEERHAADPAAHRRTLAAALHERALIRAAAGASPAAVADVRRALGVLADDPSDAARGTLARLHNALGRLLRDRTDAAAALAAFETAARLQEEMLAAPDCPPAVLLDLAGTYDGIGYHHNLLTARFDDGERAYRRAIELYREYARRVPADNRGKSGLATTLSNYGIQLFRVRNKPADAIRCYEEAVAIVDRLAAAFPHVRKYQSTLADSLGNLAVTLLRTGDRPRAKDAFRRAHDARLGLLAADPADVPSRAHAGLDLLYLCDIAAGEKDLPAAFDLADRAVGFAAAAHRAEPASYYYENILANAHESRGAMHAELGRLAQARDDLRAAVEHELEVRRLLPDVPKYRVHLTGHYDKLADVLRKLDDPAAAAVVRERAKLWPDDPDELFRSAVELAACARPGTPPADRAALAGEAVASLRRAADRGYWDAAKMRTTVWPAGVYGPAFDAAVAAALANREPAPRPTAR